MGDLLNQAEISVVEMPDAETVPNDSICVAARSTSIQWLCVGNIASTGFSHQNVRLKPSEPRLKGR